MRQLTPRRVRRIIGWSSSRFSLPRRTPLNAGRSGPDPLEALLPTRLARTAGLARPAATVVALVIASADQPLSAQEIADALGRHHTTVRPQLAALERAGVIEGVTEPPRGPGRPLRRYLSAPAPAEREAVGHRELVRLLMGLVRQTGLGPEEMERFGETQGRAVPERGAGIGELSRAFLRMGFAPEAIAGEPGEPDDLVLDVCPFADGVEAPGGELICVLHRGLARGITACAAPDIEVTALDVVDARRVGCRLRLARRQQPCAG